MNLEKEKNAKKSGGLINRNEACCNGSDFGKLFLGMIVALIGLGFLLSNLGIIFVNFNFLKLWPIFIIFIGLSLFDKRSLFGNVVGLFALLATMFFLITALSLPDTSIKSENRIIEKITSVSIPTIAGAKTAKIDIVSGVGRLDLSGKEMSGLVEGRLVSNFMEIDSKSALENGVQKVSLEERSRNINSSMRNDLTLDLSRTMPMDISLQGAVSDMDIDLSTIMANNIDISSGASSLKLKLGNKIKISTVSLNAGTGRTDISIPDDTGVLVRINSGLSSTSFKDFDKVNDNLYRSDNYETSDNKIDLNINVGLSSLNINWYSVIRSAAPENTKTVELFYYNRLADKDSSCGREYIQPVKRQIPISQTPIKDTINLLIQGQLTPTEKTQGFSTEFPNANFKLLDANYDYDSETLILRFTEVPGFTDGGSCRVGILANEIIKTAEQFGVKNVVFSPESLFQP